MSNDSQPLTGKVLPASKTKNTARILGQIQPLDALNALQKLVDAVAESIEIHETESTKREALRYQRETEVEKIKSAEATLRHYFDRVFDERHSVHERLFDGLGAALRAEDNDATQAILAGIVDVAKASPIAEIGNLTSLKHAMEDPDAVFEL